SGSRWTRRGQQRHPRCPPVLQPRSLWKPLGVPRPEGIVGPGRARFVLGRNVSMFLRCRRRGAAMIDDGLVSGENVPAGFFDVASDPCGHNPFPVEDPRYGIWRRATRRAEEEL